MMRKLFSLAAFAALMVLFSCGRGDALETQDELGMEARQKLCPAATFTLSPCDKGFRVYSWFNGVQIDVFNYPYTITYSGGSDSGQVSNGQTTNQVLPYCTYCTISIYEPCAGVTYVFYMYSDGCNNNFLC